MISPSRPWVIADLLSSTDFPTPGTRQSSQWPHLILENQDCQPKLLPVQWQWWAQAATFVKLLAQDALPKYLQLLPTKSTSTCVSDDSQPRSNTFTSNPFNRSCWWALSDPVRLDFLLSDSILRGGMEQHAVSIIAELKYVIFQLRSQKWASHFLEGHGSKGGHKDA